MIRNEQMSQTDHVPSPCSTRHVTCHEAQVSVTTHVMFYVLVTNIHFLVVLTHMASRSQMGGHGQKNMPVDYLQLQACMPNKNTVVQLMACRQFIRSQRLLHSCNFGQRRAGVQQEILIQLQEPQLSRRTLVHVQVSSACFIALHRPDEMRQRCTGCSQ